MPVTGNGAARAARGTFSICVSAAIFAAVFAVSPADAKKSKSAEIEDAALDIESRQPMTLIVSLGSQKVDIYRGTTLITTSRVSSGKPGYSTKPGVFSILEKKRRHFSNLYGGAPMPWMQRLTWSGTALHAGVVPGYPASHGCIRLPYSFAPKLFDMTTVGAHVVVARGKIAPKPIEHATLFQPLPPPPPPTLVKQEGEEPTLMRRSSNEATPRLGSRLPVILAKVSAKAETITPGAVQSAMAAVVHAPADEPVKAPVSAQASAAVPSQEDTRTHAIDPFAVPVAAAPSHAVAATPIDAGGSATQEEANTVPVKHQDRLAAQAAGPDAPSSPVVPAALLPQPEAAGAVNTAIAMKVPQPVPAEPAQADEPQVGPILTVSATTLVPQAPVPIAVAVAMPKLDVHPPMPAAKPSVIAAKLGGGTAAAAIQAAEPRSTAPLRVLVTRRTQRDRMIDVQYMLASMGYLEIQNFDGTFGKQTASAIKAFQKANDLPETGAFTDDLVKKVYEVAGKDEPASGHLFVRQEFGSVFDTPISFRNPDEPLGTHLFTVMNFAPGDTKAQWIAISLQDDADAIAVLDRIEIPDEVRQNISERLTPGSSLIIADTAINSAGLPKGADFLVWDTSKSSKVQRASLTDEAEPRPRKKRRVVTQRRSSPAYTRRYQPRGPWPF